MHFGHDRVLFRQTKDGEFVLFHEKGSEQTGYALRSGETVTSHQAWPHPNQYKTGLLKNAYLAACLSLRGVPIVESADEIRAELLSVRDASSRAAVQMGTRARDLEAHRTGSAAFGPPLALVRTGNNDEDGSYLISLAGTLLVSWPFPEVPPTVQFRTSSA